VVSIRTPQSPRLSTELRLADSVLDDEADWDGVEATAASVVQAGAVDCQITGSHLIGVRFTGAEHHRLRLLDVVLDDCELSGTVLSEATFVRVQFNRCRMSGLVASGLNAHDVTWAECKLDGVNLRAATLERSEWSDSLMNEADFYAARFTTSSFYRCDLTGAEFSKARCDGVNLHGSTLEGIGGADSLSGCCIGSDQVVDLALPLLAAMRIVVSDDADESP
jgi:uncharacterized protein YjbI with pentapeptide repeats